MVTAVAGNAVITRPGAVVAPLERAMRVTLELEEGDIARFREALKRAERLVESAGEHEVIESAKYALDHLDIAHAPGYVRKRIAEVQRLIIMLEDEAWNLPARERVDVARTLAYFSDPEDLIPDAMGLIGLLDDAIMLEILMRRFRKVLAAYDDFCRFRQELGPAPAQPGARIEHAGQLARRRESLLQGLKRRASRSHADVA